MSSSVVNSRMKHRFLITHSISPRANQNLIIKRRRLMSTHEAVKINQRHQSKMGERKGKTIIQIFWGTWKACESWQAAVTVVWIVGQRTEKTKGGRRYVRYDQSYKFWEMKPKKRPHIRANGQVKRSSRCTERRWRMCNRGNQSKKTRPTHHNSDHQEYD